jgi:hypothetical protein
MLAGDIMTQMILINDDMPNVIMLKLFSEILSNLICIKIIILFS